MSRVPDHDDYDVEDRRYDDMVQREIDEREAKKYASGISKEEHDLIHAGNLGAVAGAQDVAAGLNPYPINSPEYAEWERRRFMASTARLNRYRSAA